MPATPTQSAYTTFWPPRKTNSQKIHQARTNLIFFIMKLDFVKKVIGILYVYLWQVVANKNQDRLEIFSQTVLRLIGRHLWVFIKQCLCCFCSFSADAAICSFLSQSHRLLIIYLMPGLLFLKPETPTTCKIKSRMLLSRGGLYPFYFSALLSWKFNLIKARLLIFLGTWCVVILNKIIIELLPLMEKCILSRS